ncbi:unnamed protein product, partial [Iphiclides podalirius]
MLSNKSNKSLNGKEEEKAFSRSCTLSKQFVDNFQTILPRIIDDCLSKGSLLDNADMKARIKKMSLYYTLETKPLLGELMLYAFEILNGDESPNEELRQKAYVLACVLELGISYFLFIDDIEDESKVRFSKPCWYFLPDVGSLAMNDCSILRSVIHELLRQNFPASMYLQLINFVNKIYIVTAIGQHMDIALASKRNYDNYTMDNYCSMAVNKQIFAIKGPIVFALLLANKATDVFMHQVQDISMDIAILLQIQNDLMDLNCDGLKSSTDIQKGKCSWLAVKALEICNEKQRSIFEKCYGSWDPNHVKVIQELYEELNLSQLFFEEKQTRHEAFLRNIKELTPNIIPGVNFYQKLFKLLVDLKI